MSRPGPGKRQAATPKAPGEASTAEPVARISPIGTAEPDARIRRIDGDIAQLLRERAERERLIAHLMPERVDRSARSRSPPPHRPHPLLPRVKIVTGPNGDTVTTIY